VNGQKREEGLSWLVDDVRVVQMVVKELIGSGRGLMLTSAVGW